MALTIYIICYQMHIDYIMKNLKKFYAHGKLGPKHDKLLIPSTL